MDDFPIFLGEVRTLDHLVYSCFFLQTWPKRKWPLSSSTSGIACILLVLLVKLHLALCCQRFRQDGMHTLEVCTVDASVAVHLEIQSFFLRAPCICRQVQLSADSASGVF